MLRIIPLRLSDLRTLACGGRCCGESVGYGAAGFIGMHTAARLLARGDQVIGVDNLNNYYDVSLKIARRDRLVSNHHLAFTRLTLPIMNRWMRLSLPKSRIVSFTSLHRLVCAIH